MRFGNEHKAHTIWTRGILSTILVVSLISVPLTLVTADEPNPAYKATKVKKVSVSAEAEKAMAAIAPMDRLVSASFSQADLPDVIRVLSEQAKLNIYAGPEVVGKVTLQVQNRPVGEVLKYVLDINGFNFEQIGDDAVRVYAKPQPVKPEPPAPKGPITKVFAVDYSSADEIATAIEKLIKVDAIQTMKAPALNKGSRGNVVSGAGTIIVTANDDVMRQVEQLIRKLDKPIQQVMIDIRMVSIQLESNKDLGFGWDGALGGSWNGANAVGVGYTPAMGNLFNTSTTVAGLISAPFTAGGLTNGNLGNFVFNLSTDSRSLVGALKAMIEEQKADLLANPRLIALNNTESNFDLTEELPYVEFQLDQQTNTLTGTAKFDKKAGIQLTVAPQITSDGRIMMRVVPEQTLHKGDVKIQTAAGAPITGIPIIDIRKVDVTVMMNNGQTLVIGGLRSKNETLTESKIPWLSDIPMLGNLFKMKSTATTRSELVILVTPTIVPNDVALTTEEKMMYDKVDFF